MRKSIEKAFPHVVEKGCFEIENRTKFEIFDDTDSRSYTKTKPEQPTHLEVNNLTERPINFLALDRCLLGANDSSCDCAVFDDRMLYFVEIKTSDNMDEQHKKRVQGRKKAIEQLGATIQFFKKRNILMENYELKALICLVRRGVFPAASSTNNDARVQFEDEHNAELLEGNTIVFS